MVSEEEIRFIDAIDCNFPYWNKNECLLLIDEAIAILPNAVYTVIEEICRIPVSERENVSPIFLHELLNIISEKFEHPLKEPVIEVARLMVDNKDITVKEAIILMENIRKYPGQYAALSILYFSCDDNRGKLEELYDSILKEWNNHPNIH